jgi:hypothetical protein
VNGPFSTLRGRLAAHKETETRAMAESERARTLRLFADRLEELRRYL